MIIARKNMSGLCFVSKSLSRKTVALHDLRQYCKMSHKNLLCSGKALNKTSDTETLPFFVLTRLDFCAVPFYLLFSKKDYFLTQMQHEEKNPVEGYCF